MTNRFQRVVLNGQTSNWKKVLAGDPQGSILGQLFFLIFINDIPEGIQSNIKIFADDTSIFSVMKDRICASATLNEDLNLISNWANNWKMSFNPDPSKQAKEIVFSKKRFKNQLPALMFNNTVVPRFFEHWIFRIPRFFELFCRSLGFALTNSYKLPRIFRIPRFFELFFRSRRANSPDFSNS